MKIAFYVLACAVTSVAFAQMPPTPVITAAATDIKQLQFDITPVPRVNSYELWFQANPGAQWVNYAQTPAQRPRFRIGTSVHLLDWQQARYYVKACNPSGCAGSLEVGVDGEQLAAMGYFKPATSGPNQYFGFNFKVSADGTTLVVVAAEKIDHVSGRAGIHVFRKGTATSGWRLETRLFPNPNNPGASAVFGDSIAVSSDGKTIAYGNWVENGTTGAVYLFHRAADGWHQTQRIAGESANDQFGVNVKLDAAGKILVVGHSQPGGVKREGTLEVYRAATDGDQFLHATTIPTPEFDDAQWGYCRTIGLSEAGHIARSCFSGANLYYFTQVLTAVSNAPLLYMETARLTAGTGADVAIDSAGEHLAIQELQQGRSYVSMYRRNATGWVPDGTLEQLGGVSHLTMSGDGRVVAVGWTDDKLAGLGPVFEPYQLGEETGTVAIYEHRASGWALRRFIKAGANHYLHSFGWQVSLDQSGKVLAVGSPYDPSKATGIDGDREDASVSGRGAVWLY